MGGGFFEQLTWKTNLWEGVFYQAQEKGLIRIRGGNLEWFKEEVGRLVEGVDNLICDGSTPKHCVWFSCEGLEYF